MTTQPSIACEINANVVETTHAKHESKANLRRTLLAARAGLLGDVRTGLDTAIADNLRTYLRRSPAQSLGVFWPIRGEPDLRKLYAELAAAGMALALPVMTGRQAPLCFAAWAPGAAVTLDRWGLATPVDTLLVTPQVLLVPCLGFNAQGFRLGYGGGFYDRTLALLPRPRTIGIAYTIAQAAFAADAHDIALDVVLTDLIQRDCRDR